MKKFSSFGKSQMLFENWRGHINEGAPEGPIETHPSAPESLYGVPKSVKARMKGGTEEEAGISAIDLAKNILTGLDDYSGEDLEDQAQKLARMLEEHDEFLYHLHDFIEELPQRSLEREQPLQEQEVFDEARILELASKVQNIMGNVSPEDTQRVFQQLMTVQTKPEPTEPTLEEEKKK